jgi:WD40 repeat protein
VETIAFSRDGKTFATGGGDGVVRIWDTSSHAEIKALRGSNQRITSVAYSPAARLLVASAGTGPHSPGVVHFWDPSTGDHLGSRQPEFRSGVLKVLFWPDGTKLAVGAGESQDGVVEVWELGPVAKSK